MQLFCVRNGAIYNKKKIKQKSTNFSIYIKCNLGGIEEKYNKVLKR